MKHLVTRTLEGVLVLVLAAACGPPSDADADRLGRAVPANPEAQAAPASDTTSRVGSDAAPAGPEGGSDAAPNRAARTEPDAAHAAGPAEDTVPGNPTRSPGGSARSTSPRSAPSTPGSRPAFERPQHVRGIYLNAWTAGARRRVADLVRLADSTELNTFVIDLKDASGYVSHATGVALAYEVGATDEPRIDDLGGLLRRLAEAGVYPIARIVIVKDPVLVEARPDLAVQDTAGGVWIDGKGIRWLNPYAPEVWAYHVDLAREAVRLGFPEIQWDYVRFPDAPRSELERATYPGADERTKAEVIRDFLAHSREELRKVDEEVQVTADVFGVTTTARDVGIGQVWDEFIGVVDVALPMVYPSHYWRGSYGFEHPNAYPYEIVRRALSDALRRSEAVEGAGRTRPWLQDFSLGPPAYGVPEVRAQIQATYDAGIEEWILWNPSSRFTEGALEPAGGFDAEPRIRVADTLVVVSERHEVLSGADMTEASDAGGPEGPQGDTLSAARDSSEIRR